VIILKKINSYKYTFQREKLTGDKYLRLPLLFSHSTHNLFSFLVQAKIIIIIKNKIFVIFLPNKNKNTNQIFLEYGLGMALILFNSMFPINIVRG